MVDTIEQALNPLFLATFIFGCGILRYPLDQSRYRFSIFYILTVWSVYACAFYQIEIRFFTTNIFNNYLCYFLVATNLSVTLISIIITVREHEKFYVCIRKLGIVNNTLEELGTPNEYHRLRNSIKWTLITLFFMTCISLTFDSLLCIEAYKDTKAFIVPLIMNQSLHVNTIMDIMFMFLLRHIGSRLDKINDHIIQLSEAKDYELRSKWEKPLVVNSQYRNAKNRKHVLWIVMHLHLELCRIARDINSFFGIQMTLQMLSYFVVLTDMFIFQYNVVLHIKEMSTDDITPKILLSCNTGFIIFLTKLISLNHICESVSTKARRTKNVIYRLTNLMSFVEVRNEISQFILQMSLLPLKFSGMGMFYFGYNFLRKFFVWILTAVLFVVQLNVPIYIVKNNITHYDQK